MKQPNRVADSTRNLVTGLFQQILDTLPTGCASLSVEPSKDPEIISVLLVPSSERSAKFGVVLMGERFDSVFFGRSPTYTHFECPWEIGLSRSAGLDQHLDVVSKMCLGVIAGKCEHRIERRWTRGVIHISEKEGYQVRDVGILRLIWPRRNLQAVQYEPYFPGAESQAQSSSRLSV
jgi:hypothetical protein